MKSKTAGHSISRRLLINRVLGGSLFALFSATASNAQSSGVLTISIDENLGSTYGLAEIYIHPEPQGVLSAGCCMYLQVGKGTHDLLLRWPDHEVSTVFETDGTDTIAYHLTAERSLTRIRE